MLGALLVHATIAFQNQAYIPRCLTKPLKSCRQTLISFATTLLVFLLAAFSLKVTGEVPRLALGMGMVTAVTLLVAQRLLICRIVRRAFGEMTAELVIVDGANLPPRSEEHTSELQSLMRISYAVFCLKKKKKTHN